MISRVIDIVFSTYRYIKPLNVENTLRIPLSGLHFPLIAIS